MELKFWLGQVVSIKEPGIKATVIKITFEGSIKETLTTYRVRYWINGELYEINLSEEDLQYIDTHETIKIGFNKQGEKLCQM